MNGSKRVKIIDKIKNAIIDKIKNEPQEKKKILKHIDNKINNEVHIPGANSLEMNKLKEILE